MGPGISDSKDVLVRSRIKAALGVLLTTLTLGAMSAAPAAAVTGSAPDGNLHPNVGLILFYDATGRFRCTATLVTPTVLLTAAHCTDGTVGKTLVDFRSAAKETGPSSGYAAATVPANGYTQARSRPWASGPGRRTPTRTTPTSPTSRTGTTSA